jgi:hypothetical protein
MTPQIVVGAAIGFSANCGVDVFSPAACIADTKWIYCTGENPYTSMSGGRRDFGKKLLQSNEVFHT